jgi:hypothetical protein
LLPYHEWVNIPRHPAKRTFEIADIFLPDLRAEVAAAAKA